MRLNVVRRSTPVWRNSNNRLDHGILDLIFNGAIISRFVFFEKQEILFKYIR